MMIDTQTVDREIKINPRTSYTMPPMG